MVRPGIVHKAKRARKERTAVKCEIQIFGNFTAWIPAKHFIVRENGALPIVVTSITKNARLQYRNENKFNDVKLKVMNLGEYLLGTKAQFYWE